MLCLLVMWQANAAAKGHDQTEEKRRELISGYGIDLVENAFSDRWDSHEIADIVLMLKRLPKELQHAEHDRIHKVPVKFLKNNRLFSFHCKNIVTYQSNGLSKPFSGEKIANKDHLPAAAQILYYLIKRYDNAHKISRNKEWLEMSEWGGMKVFGLNIPIPWKWATNKSPKAYAFPFGMKNPEEDLIATAIYFILPVNAAPENTIKCRIPGKYLFMKKHFPDYSSWLDAPNICCKDMEDEFLEDIVFLNPDTGEEINIGPVNMDTVTGFEILYATPGTGDVSEIAGHLVLRITLNNNPSSVQNGIENPYDLVISFLADTDDGNTKQIPVEADIPVQPECKKNWFNIVNNNANDEPPLESIVQSLKGLSGGFLTIMDRQTLLYTLKSYTIEQGRDLLRFKLNLTDTQKKNLLERLFSARKHYQAAYYFFSQNCASVLFHVIAQGIGEEDLIRFDPLVSPPNTLISMMVRKKIAEPVYPSFYSYRKKGYIAQELLKEDLNRLSDQLPFADWPETSRLISRHVDTRLSAAEDLEDIAKIYPETSNAIYRLAVFTQEAEMAYSYKDLRCENYTSSVTAEARRMQQEILGPSEKQIDDIAVDADQQMEDYFSGLEKKARGKGTSHTGHYRFSAGAGFYDAWRSDTEPVIMLEGALHRQPMGSRSNLSMQRSSSIDFFSMSLMVEENRFRPAAFTFTALQLRKFRDRLNRVPSFYEPAGNFGLGLTLLDIYGSGEEKSGYGTYAGIEGLLSIWSAPDHDRYLYISGGAELAGGRSKNALSKDRDTGPDAAILLPFRIETLISFDDNRRWQFRNEIEYAFSTRKNTCDEFLFKTGLSCFPFEITGQDIILKLAYQDRGFFPQSSFSGGKHIRAGSFQIEINRW